MTGRQILGLVIYLVVGTMVRILTDGFGLEVSNIFYSPLQIYKYTTMNWFGAVVYYIFLWIISPILQFGCLIYLFCKFIYWICHVGRKNI